MGNRMIMAVALAIFIFATPFSGGFTAEKVKLGTLKDAPQQVLPVYAAEEQGIWKRNELDIEWVPFGSGGALTQALAARALNLAVLGVATHIQGVAAGLPIVVVSDFYLTEDFFVWVRADAPFKGPSDLKGAKIGVGRFGSTEHAYGRMVAKALGLEKEIKFLATGGIAETVAMIKTGAVDACVLRFINMVDLKLLGLVRELTPVADYHPREWVNTVLSARRDFARTRPELVTKVIRALLQSFDHLRANPRWSVDKLKMVRGFSEEAAKQAYAAMEFTRDGKVDRKGLVNVRQFLIEYGIVSAAKAPSVDELYTSEFTW